MSNGSELREGTDSYQFNTGTNPDENFAQGPGPIPFDQNFVTYAHQLWLWSNNALIYPGALTMSGNWNLDDTATAKVAWGTEVRKFTAIAAQGDSAQVMATKLHDLMAADTVFAATPIFISPVGNFNGGWSFHVNPPWSTWNSTPRLSITASADSASGHCSVTTQPSNVLDTPASTLTLLHTVPGRPAQPNDLIAEITAYGQNSQINGPDDKDARQIYTRIQFYIDDPSSSAPVGRMQLQMASANINNVINRMIFRLGMLLCDANGAPPHGGHNGDMGPGTINLPGSGGIYRDGRKVL